MSVALRRSGLLALVVVALAFAAQALQVQTDTIVTALISLVAVIGIGIFSGNAGILSFGHVAFMAIAAYTYGLLTVAPPIKTSALPELPSWLAELELSPPLAVAATLAVVALVALPMGLAIMRTSRASGTVITLALLLAVNALLLAASDYTRGAQTFYGVTGTIAPAGAVGAAVVAILVAQLFRESRIGIGLRATRDSELAAGAMGVDVRWPRLAGWTLSAVVAAAAGIALAVYLGAFSPSSYYLDLTFALIAMLIVGGTTTTSGAVAGVVLVSVVQELARRAESGVSLGGVETPEVLGLPQLAIGAVLLLVMMLRPAGLFGVRELDVPIKQPTQPDPVTAP